MVLTQDIFVPITTMMPWTQIPKISMDYFYLSTEDEKCQKNTSIIMMEEGSGNMVAYAVGDKSSVVCLASGNAPPRRRTPPG